MEMEEHNHLPDANRLSVVAATIMLVYSMTPYVQSPSRVLIIQLPGVIFPLTLNFATLASLVVALLAAVGAAWLLQTHPHASGKRMILRHGLIPGLTAWVIGVPLFNLQIGLQWWAVFAFGGLLFVLVLVAEYIALEPDDVRHGLASVGLTAVAYALLLILAIATRSAGTRLYLLVPMLFAALALTAMRTLYLRLNGRWCWVWALGIAATVSQLAVGLHYLPLTALQYSLLLTGLAYALTGLAANWEEERTHSGLWLGPVLMLVVIWALAFTA